MHGGGVWRRPGSLREGPAVGIVGVLWLHSPDLVFQPTWESGNLALTLKPSRFAHVNQS